MTVINFSDTESHCVPRFELFGEFREDDPYYLEPIMGLRFLKDTKLLTIMQADVLYKEGFLRYDVRSIKLEDRKSDMLIFEITRSGNSFEKTV